MDKRIKKLFSPGFILIMSKLKKYFQIIKIIFLIRLGADVSFRFSFLATILGSFCFISLYIAVIKLLMQNVIIPGWGINEMWLLLGLFIIFCYATFFLFWRGLWFLPEHIRNGQLDFYLTKPIDSQFIVSVAGGGTHNFLAMLFGLLFTVWSIFNLNLQLETWQILLSGFALLVSILDFYSIAFFFGCLNFKMGYLGDASYRVFDFQAFSRYPTEVFKNLPIAAFVIVMPFSLVTTIPTQILLGHNLTFTSFSVFILVSFLVICFSRWFWFHSIRNYTSASS